MSKRLLVLSILLGVALLPAGCRSPKGAVVGPAAPASKPKAAKGSPTEDQLAHRLIRACGGDPSKVPAPFQERFLRLVQEQKCPCTGRSVGPLAECTLPGDKQCIRGVFASRSILLGLAHGGTDQEIGEQLVGRFGPRTPEKIDLAQAPCRGPEKAAAVFVLFSDFQCPGCAMARKLGETLEKAAGPYVRLCFKNLPLRKIHKQAQLAAQAALAANKQGRFWPMHDKLFDNQTALDRDDLLGYAKELGLDARRFKADLDSSAVKAQVERDVAEAERLGVQGTPTFYINGREMTDPMTVPHFLDWIAEAAALAKAKEGGPTSRPAGK
ncbi:MAG: thioredoxin domain-containing protein [Deltaproteobacteria bacterium]|nr:thioredoxin domain-containing protein [Deltaproteobacteria bacterium]